MKPPAISINVIAKDCPEQLRKCLTSVYQHLFEDGDETVVVDTGSTDLAAMEAVVAEFKAATLVKQDLVVDIAPLVDKWLRPDLLEEFRKEGQYRDGRTLLDFATARTAALGASANEWIFWIDTDDVLEEATSGTLRKVLTEHAERVDGIFLDYLYDFDTDGTCTTILRRERLFRRDRFHWVGRCHETAIPRPGVATLPVAYFEGSGTTIRHTEFRKPHRISDIRNYCIMRRELEETGIDKGDPRTVFYLANACRGLGLFQDAVSYYRQFNLLSGSEEDRFCAAYYVGGIYLEPTVRRPVDARAAFMKCAEIKPTDPRPYFGLARCAAAMHRYRESLHWYQVGCQRTMDRTLHSFDPTHVDYHPHVLAAFVAKEVGDPTAALECIERAAAVRPKHAAEDLARIRAWAAGKTYADQLLATVRYMEGKDLAKETAQRIASRLRGGPPEALERAGIGALEPPDPRPVRPSLTVFCGSHSDPWHELSAKVGIGGSEKMVILVARALQARGVNVTVYAEVPQGFRGVSEESGVLWRHWSEVDFTRHRDVVVLWRNPGAALLPFRTGRRVVWCHDIQNPAAYTEDVLAVVDDVQVQSAFHATTLGPAFPPGRIWVARNAVDTALLPTGIVRDPKHVVYMSSPDRGLYTAAKVMELVRQRDPDFHLTVLYGVTTWARKAWATNQHRCIPDLGRDASVDEWEAMTFRQLDRIGASVHHMVSFDTVSRVLAGAGVWLYPTRFDEISCMSAMEAQCAGVVPVCTLQGALKETVLPGPGTRTLTMDDPIQRWADAVLRAATVPIGERDRLAKRARAAFNLDDLADAWLKRLFPEIQTPGGSVDVAADQTPQASQGADDRGAVLTKEEWMEYQESGVSPPPFCNSEVEQELLRCP